MDFRDSNLFVERWGRQQIGASLRQKCFAGAGWARKKNVVTSGNGNGECTFGNDLAKNIV
jgi:hypothetical protein